ncbi:MAG: RidA family protein [Armatimonadota bacterium]|nr:RidA family protein [Armatimonadota bacterium]
MQQEIISTDRAPRAIGPYAQAVRAGGLLFLSGQIALDPQTGQLVGTDIKQQTRQVLENVRAILEASGSSLRRVVKCTVFLAQMDDFGPMNEEYGAFFQEEPPARTTVAVSRLPRGALVEIDVVALAGEGRVT